MTVTLEITEEVALIFSQAEEKLRELFGSSPTAKELMSFALVGHDTDSIVNRFIVLSAGSQLNDPTIQKELFGEANE